MVGSRQRVVDRVVDRVVGRELTVNATGGTGAVFGTGAGAGVR